MNKFYAITLILSKNMQNYEIKIEKIEEKITQLNITLKEFLIIKTINELRSRYKSWVMLLSQESRKENKLFTLKQLFDHLKQKEHRMSISNVVIAVNRVQTDSYQPDSYQSKSSNSNHRGRKDARDRDETRNSSRERGERDESQSNQNNN